MIGSLGEVGHVVRIERKVGNIRLTICVEEEALTPDANGRVLPPLSGMPRVTMPWTDIGQRVNLIAHDFINELCGNCACIGRPCEHHPEPVSHG